MSEQIQVVIDGKERVLEGPVLLRDLAEDYADSYKTPIVLAIQDGKLKELNRTVSGPAHITWLDMLHRDGLRTYQRSLSFVISKAFEDVFGMAEGRQIIVQFSINNGYYVEVTPKSLLENGGLEKLNTRMQALVDADLPMVKEVHKTDAAIEIFREQGMFDKVDLLKYRRVSNINLYNLDGFYNYFYGYMVPSTGYLKDRFELFLFDEGLVMQFLDPKDPSRIAPFDPDKMLYQTLKESTEWGHQMEVDHVGELNDLISTGEMQELIFVQEALMEKRIGLISDMIMEDVGNKKFVFIAGPSSSGKTTFAHRLSIQLRSQGIRPKPVSVDNYFVNREDTPLDEEGNYNFECLEAIDVAQFNEDMTRLLNGEEVPMPSFNFVTGEREYKGNTMILGDNDILVIEGIHALNPKMTHAIPEENKFKIYISALTALNVDDHNRIPTTDARLIRRMVRDNQYRGASAQKTIGMWPSVRRGEEQYIFPFQEEADVMFNSALIYELSVLKQYAEPLLFNVPRDTDEYVEAKRLIKFLDYFLGITSESIPSTSLVREFIGGSIFRG